MDQPTSTPQGTGDTRLSVEQAAQAFANILPDEDTQDYGEEQPRQQDAADGDPEGLADEGLDPDQEAAGSEEETDEEQEEQQGSLVASDDAIVEIDGQQITVKELKRGHLRESDYTRKTQALAEERKQTAAERAQVQAERAQYAQLLDALHQQLTSTQEQEPDWDALYKADPMEWAYQRDKWNVRREQAQAIEAERQRVAQAQAAELATVHRARLQEEKTKLLDAIPEWKDEKVAKQERAALVEYGVKLGFTEQDVRAISDHKVVNVLRKAYLYDRAQEARRTSRQQGAQQQQVRTAAPGGASQQRRVVSDQTRAKQRLAKTGRVEHAAAVIADLIEL